MPSGCSRRGVLRSPQTTRGPLGPGARPDRRRASVASPSRWRRWGRGSCRRVTPPSCAASAVGGDGTSSGGPGVRERCAGLRQDPGAVGARRGEAAGIDTGQAAARGAGARSSRARRAHIGAVRVDTSCNATTSGSRSANAVACSASRVTRRLTFQVMTRTKTSVAEAAPGYGASCRPGVGRGSVGSVRRRWRVLSGGGLLALALTAAPAASAAPQAPGAPGTKPTWEKADKHAFGTSATLREQGVVHAAPGGAQRGLLPRPRHAGAARPRVRGEPTGARRARETRGTRASVRRVGGSGLTFRQVVTDRRGRWRLEEDLRLLTPRGRPCWSTSASVSLTGAPVSPLRPRRPGGWVTTVLDDRGRAVGGALVARDDGAASALAARPRAACAERAATRAACDPWHRLRAAHSARGRRPRCAGPATSARRREHRPPPGRARARGMTLALGFGGTPARGPADGAKPRRVGFATAARAYARRLAESNLARSEGAAGECRGTRPCASSTTAR